MRVLVTGASGQVGSYLMDELAATIGVDRRPSPWATIVQDVRGPLDADADAIVHCAAQVSVGASVEDPRADAADNIDGTLAMLEWGRRADVERFVYISSAAVYGSPRSLPIREDHPTVPTSGYGLSKLTGEKYARLYADLYGLPTVVLRPFNIFSARQDPGSPYSGVLSIFLDRARRGEPFTIDGDGGQTRDLVHVSDVVAAVRLALEDPAAPGEVWNVGTGKPTSILELAAAVVAATGSEAAPVHGPRRKGDIRDSVADIRRLRSFGFRSKTDLRRDIAALLHEPRTRRDPA